MQVAVEPFNFLLLPVNIHYVFRAHRQCRFDALRDLRDTQLALLC